MITFIPTPIGNPQDITIRAMRAFESADIFLCEDTRQTKKLLRLLEERFDMRFPQADFYSFHEHNGAERIAGLGRALAEQNIVFVSDAGMPAISDPGQVLVRYAQEQAIAYDVLPGASAVTTAYAASGFEHGEFLFFGFLPHKGKERQLKLDEVLSCGYDAILYEAPHRLDKLLDALSVADPARELFAAKELTKRYQRYYRGAAATLRDQIKAETIRGEWVVVIRAQKNDRKSLSFESAMRLDLPPKPKAKLLAQLSDKSTKEWYALLSQEG
jgi:16S rRNA (cytidine1402-2'-O)-methyltransferase